MPGAWRGFQLPNVAKRGGYYALFARPEFVSARRFRELGGFQPGSGVLLVPFSGLLH